MNSNAIAAFLALNILITGGLGYLVISGQKQDPVAEKSAAPTPAEIKIDVSAMEAPLAQLTDKVDQLNQTVQRFSTSYVQYDFLKREMDRLSVADQSIGVRAQATAATKNDKNAKEVDEVIGKLSNLSQQVKGQLQTRRQTMLKLISGLENELASISGSATPAPAPAPAPAPTPTPVAPKPTPPTPPTVPAVPPNIGNSGPVPGAAE